jgi:ABC-type glycerol-3-phosphate transport system substrate-binding protein
MKGADMNLKPRWLALTSLVTFVAVAAALVAVATGGANSGKASGSITVWVDAVRLPVAKLYVKTHPNVHVKVVTYDGDGNGATTMQTKIQLWNRTGNGWPDVVFTEQANDPVWMAQPPFDFAMNLKGVFPAKLLKGWPAPSLGQCTVNGRLVCLQDNLAQEVLYVNKKLMKKFGYTVPTTWQQWAALGAKVAKDHPGYIIGNMGDSFSHWLYLWPDRCPISQVVAPNTVRINSANVQCTRMASLLDPLIKSGVVPPESVFTPAFAQKYGGADDKILLMPGPTWYAKDIFGGTLKVPAGEMTAAAPLRWNNEPPTTGQVGGGPWVVSRHTKNAAAAIDFVKFATTSTAVKGKPGALSPGYPSYGPAATLWLKNLNKDPYFAAPPGAAMKAAAPLVWKGWSMVTYPDQPVWSNSVVTQLVAGKPLSELLSALGDGLSNNAKAAGYKVVNK